MAARNCVHGPRAATCSTRPRPASTKPSNVAPVEHPASRNSQVFVAWLPSDHGEFLMQLARFYRNNMFLPQDSGIYVVAFNRGLSA